MSFEISFAIFKTFAFLCVSFAFFAVRIFSAVLSSQESRKKKTAKNAKDFAKTRKAIPMTTEKWEMRNEKWKI